MSNEFYTHSTYPTPNSPGSSATLRAELESIETGFEKLPALAGQGGKVAAVNAGGTALEATSSVAGLALTGGSINNTPIGATTPSTAAFTSASASTGFTGNLTGNVGGNLAGNVTSAGTSAFNNVTISGSLDMNAGTSSTVTGLSAPTNSTDAATKLYVDTSISNLVNSAPGTLDTLNELATALGNDPNFATTMTNSIATKLPLAGGTMSGVLNMGSQKITNLAAPTVSSDAVTLNYVTTLYGSTAAAEASATAAASSASAASSSASAASTSASNASTSANAALSSLNSFVSQYYGSAATDPTLDPLGNAPTAGDMYFNTASNVMKAYSGSAWQVTYNPIPGVALSDITAAGGAATLANGNNPIAWNWTQTVASQTGFAIGETTASTGGSGSQVLLKIGTVAASTADPLQVLTRGSDSVRVSRSGNVTITGISPVGEAAPILTLQGGVSGAAQSGNSGGIVITGGSAGAVASVAGGPIVLTAGAGSTTTAGGIGGAITVTAGAGGLAASGGNLTLSAGVGGATGVGGDFIINTAAANVNVERLRVLANGAWSVGTGGAATGTSGQVLTSTGATTAPVWQAAASANVQTFTTVGTSTWTKPTGATFVQIETWGGGGGGGGGQTGAAATNRTGGNGGSGGAYSTRTFAASEIPATVSVTVGAGGTGGLANVNGTAGGNSSFGTFAIGYAGGAGLRGNGAANITPNAGAGVLGIDGFPANGLDSGQFGAGSVPGFMSSSGSPSGYGGGGGGAGTLGGAGGNGGASYQGGGGGGAGGGINTANTFAYSGAGGSPQGTMYYGTGGNPASAGSGVRTFGTSPSGGFRSGGAGGIAAPAAADAGFNINANHVTYANGIFVFSSNGIIYQSADGITWTTSQNVTGVYLDGSSGGTNIIWDGVQWVIADRLGCIFTSPDLITFTKQVSVLVTVQGTTLNKLVYTNGKYIAVAANGSVFTTSNLTTGWAYTLSVGAAAYDACWDGNYWIVVGALTVARSSDFVTWTKYTKAFNIFSCASNYPVSNRTIFGTSSGNYYTDDGGLTTTITTGSVASGYPNQIIWDGVRFVSGNTSLGGGVSWSNADGTTWTNTGIGGGNVGGPAYNGTNYVITVSARTSSYYSSSLPTFTQSPVVPIWYAGNGGWGGIAGGGGGGGAGITGSTTGSKGGNGGSGMVRICSW